MQVWTKAGIDLVFWLAAKLSFGVHRLLRSPRCRSLASDSLTTRDKR